MNLTLDLVLLIGFPLLVLEAIFSGSEISLLSADRIFLKSRAQNGSKSAILALKLLKNPEHILSSTLLITSLCVVLNTSVMTLFCLRQFGHRGEFYSILIASPLVILFGELIPKTLFQRFSNATVVFSVWPVYFVYLAFYPVTWILSWYTLKLSNFLSPVEEMITGRRKNSREELESVLLFGKTDTNLKQSERQIIKRIFDFKDSEAKHALIPLVRVDAIEIRASVREALENFRRHRHSRMPVFSERIDNIIGVLEATDLLFVKQLDDPILPYISSGHYIAETQSLEDLLREMEHEDTEMVVVVDEYGGAIGVITFEDIIEEIVGEIEDEFDSEQFLYSKVTQNSWVVQAKMEIPRLNEELAVSLPEGDYETLGGFLLQQFGRIPEYRDELYFTTSTGDYKFVIRAATEKQINSVFIEKIDVKVD